MRAAVKRVAQIDSESTELLTQVDWSYLPINVIAGKVSNTKIADQWMAVAARFFHDGSWAKIIARYGIATFLIGKAEDKEFERHLNDGPYFVIDEAAPVRYRIDPRVHFISGQQELFTAIFPALRRKTVKPVNLI